MICTLHRIVVGAVGSMLLVLLMTMATASLSASFAVFLVRERANKSKHVQVKSYMSAVGGLVCILRLHFVHHAPFIL